MAVSNHLITTFTKEILNTDINIIPRFLALDVYALSYIFDNDEDFSLVTTIILSSLHKIKAGEVDGEDLIYALSNWKSYHFQSTLSKVPGEEDLRAVYKKIDTSLNVLGFGHRYIPSDFYERIKSRI